MLNIEENFTYLPIKYFNGHCVPDLVSFLFFRN